MSNKFLKAKDGLNLEPQTSPPTGLGDGDMYHDATTGLMVRTAGVVAPAGSAGAPASSPSGSVIMFAGLTEPSGWVFCYGQAVSRATYAALFTAISTTYGPGDGSTTFNLPDLRGRTAFGRDDMGGVAASRITNAVSGIVGTTLGASGGSQILHLHSHGAGTFATTLSGTFASSGHTHPSGTIAACAHTGISSTIFTIKSVATPTWAVTGRFDFTVVQQASALSGTTGLATVGDTSTPSATSSLTGSNTVAGTSGNAGTGASQNIPPAIILNYIIKT